ncbi:MAG: N-acetyl-gamma-glutamyl-phosphate reductase [Spirochaetaceae bacterium]|jgi:N-acetyl-gamma-glutamyl-phosphate reductase|nr:N-acetyl-gamma-glutamyl-phosphate reductase [Spirochaetaceae bacterium]
MANNKKLKVFIDGQHGTVGLQIRERLKDRPELQIIEIENSLKKDIEEKRKILNQSDIVFLCLPDAVAKESVSLITNPDVKVLDGSTAHRIDNKWVYGIPELNKTQRSTIRESKRITVPGCYASGFILPMHPLVSKGIVPSDYPVSTYAITGYSGGGKEMIASYKENKDSEDYSCRPKNLNLTHKHLPEMQKYGLLDNKPIFTPIVGNFYKGMLVFIPLYKNLLQKNLNQTNLIEFYKEYYKDENFINIFDKELIKTIDSDFISPGSNNNTNNLDILVFENDEQFLIVSRLDNLGKGASGAAVQNMNLLIDVPENTGL